MSHVRHRRTLDEAAAAAVLRAAEALARERGHRVVIAIVDAAGELVALRRTPDAQAASSRVAVDKARTAARFRRPTRALEEQISGGRLGALALHGAAALTGGVPLVAGGEVVGAIGTSGETPDEDEAISLAGAAAPLPDDGPAVPALTLAGARAAVDAAVAAAAARGVAPVVAAVDAAGDLLALARPDGAQPASVDVAIDKARTAAIYRRPSADFERQTAEGRPSALHLARAVPLQGGVPVEHGGTVAGAVGVSGASSADEDSELARAGVAAVADGPGDAAFFPAAAVDAGGGVLHDAGAFALDAGRRTAPGEAEVHAATVDVMHVVRGTATVVTGGTPVDPREVAPGEVRAAAIDGGTERALAPGDVLAIPSGVPHQFVAVSDPFLYFVVKVAA